MTPLIGWPFFVQPIEAKCWRRRSSKIQKILGKKTIFSEHPVYLCVLTLFNDYYCLPVFIFSKFRQIPLHALEGKIAQAERIFIRK